MVNSVFGNFSFPKKMSVKKTIFQNFNGLVFLTGCWYFFWHVFKHLETFYEKCSFATLAKIRQK